MNAPLPHPPSPSRLERMLAGRPPELANAITASRLLFRIAHHLEARIDAALAPLGIGMGEYLALVLIGDQAHEPLRPSDLSITLDATRTQVTRLLDGLEKKGLIQRLPGREDRRSFELAQTPAAQALLQQAAPLAHAVYAAAWAPLGTNGTRTALAQLQQVHAAVCDSDLRERTS